MLHFLKSSSNKTWNIHDNAINKYQKFSFGFWNTNNEAQSNDGNSREWSALVSLSERENVRGLLGMATCRKWCWDYIPAITITYLKSVQLLDSIMLYLMGGTASRVWHDIRGRVNIYPVRFLKCPDLQWPLCCPLHIYCRALATATRVYFCLSSRE